MKKLNVLISGAGIAGPALAWWLGRAGHTTTIVERAPALRKGGQAVDFRGPVHRAVLERMELWEPIHERRTQPADLDLLDVEGQPYVSIPAVMTGGDVEILRGELCQLLYERTRDATEYRFGDWVTALEQAAGGVTVQFVSGDSATFDLVVGADGLHSGVRALAFGPEDQFLRHHGYRVATYSMPNVLALRGRSMIYALPGRAASFSTARDPSEARALFMYTAGPLERRRDVEAQKQEVRERFADMGWEVPRLLEGLDRATDLYVDSIGSIAVPSYSNGRVVLLGDAAYGGTLGGQGNSLAFVGAYVLAGELAKADGEHASAFARYEEQLRPYATMCQKGAKNVGPFYAPRTRWGRYVRDRSHKLLVSRPFIGLFEKMVKADASRFVLPNYA